MIEKFFLKTSFIFTTFSAASFFAFFLLLFCSNIKANQLNNIDMNITLDENGNAFVTEVWSVYSNKDTEYYKCMYNLDKMSISDFSVSMDDKLFTYNNNYNINASFDRKKYTNGFNYTKDVVELCFGISEYGSHKYTLKYTINNIIFNTNDAQVLYFKFIDGMSIMNNLKFNIVVSGPYDYEDTLEVWGYGIKGYTYVENGKIYSLPEENVYLNGEDDYYVMLVKYPVNTFNSNIYYNKYTSFNDVLNSANSETYNYDYDEDGNIFSGIMRAIFKIILFVALFLLGKRFADSQKKYKFGEAGKKIDMKSINMFRDIPCNKDIFRAYFIVQVYSLNEKNTDFIGSLFLKWINNDSVFIKKEMKNGLFKNKEVTSLVLNSNASFDNVCEKELFNIIDSASKDGILEGDEFSKYCRINYQRVLNWFDDAENYGRDCYVSDGTVIKEKSKYFISDSVKNDAIELAGLKKFLLEFSRLDKKEAIEVKLWKEYLMYAQKFGIADKVAKQFEKLYPEVLEQMKSTNLDIADIILLNNISRNAVYAASSARSAARSYSSGGGGFNIGGGGGGSFGGGGGGSR